MSKFVVGSLLLIFLCAMMLTGMEATRIIRNMDTLQSAIFAARPMLAIKGCITNDVRDLVRRNITAAGMDANRVAVSGTRDKADYGSPVEITATYTDSKGLMALVDNQLSRTIHTVSERAPGGSSECS